MLPKIEKITFTEYHLSLTKIEILTQNTLFFLKNSCLQNIASAFFHEGVVLLGGKADQEDVLLIVGVHEADHLLDALGDGFALDAVLNPQLFHHLLHIRHVRHGAGVSSLLPSLIGWLVVWVERQQHVFTHVATKQQVELQAGQAAGRDAPCRHQSVPKPRQQRLQPNNSHSFTPTASSYKLRMDRGGFGHVFDTTPTMDAFSPDKIFTNF